MTKTDRSTGDAAPGSFLPRLKQDLFSWLQALVFALICLVLCFTFLGRIISVDGSSMYPTLEDRDMLLLQSIAYTPAAGDIVVITKPFELGTPIVKRVIATGGQTVRIDYTEGAVYVDDVAIEEPYINEPMLPSASPFETISYAEVPEGSVFVMGDNRNNSSDSRDERLGLVDERYILGRAVYTLFPFHNIGAI